MTKYQTFKIINSELKKLNRVIDKKIIRGIPYRREAQKHRELLLKFRQFAPEAGWFNMNIFY